MTSTLFSLTTALLTAFAPMDFYTIVEDHSELPILNPDLQNRQTLKLQLANGLNVLIISDDKADQSAAAVRVGAGSWHDPVEYPGMAHFCEHMLFMGTKKYPSDNEFFTLVSDHGGQTNAFTAPNRTVYMFSSQESGFLSLLDRFAHFFIDPLFNPDNIAREMHAVDQEYAKNIENDAWREYMIFKETGNQNHPNRYFSTGNSETLSKIPQNHLKKWHKELYGADKMHLVIYSSLPVSVLKDQVIETFSEVPQSAKAHLDTSGQLTSYEQMGSILYIKPIKNRQTLTLAWELPPELSKDETKSADLVAFSLRRGQKYSLYEKLKNEQLIDTMSVRIDDLGGPEHRFFQITFELTKKGIEQYNQTALHAFEAIANIQKSGVPKYLFDERNAMAQLNYQYQERENPFDFITALADSVADEDLSTYPRNRILSKEYSPEKIATVAAHLTPENCTVSLMAPPELTKVVPTSKEQWLGAEYAMRPLPGKWVDAWAKASPNKDIRTPSKNPFIPEHLMLVKSEGTMPQLIADDDLGSAYYVRSSEFSTPEIVYHLHILSPEINQNPRSSVLTSLYIDHLTDVMHPTLAAAKAAGLSCRFGLDRSALYLRVMGYSEKAPLLLQTIVKEMPANPPTLEQFAIYMDRHEKGYQNAQKELAVRQAKELIDSIVNLDKSTNEEKLRALHSISYEDFLDFHQKLFETTYIQALFAGNLSTKQAESAWLDVIHFLGKSPFPKDLHPKTQIIQLPDSSGPYKLTKRTDVQGNAALLMIDEGVFTQEKRAAQEILTGALKNAFFDELRSKQKTGYIAHSDSNEIEERLFHYFLVQSNSHQPEELLFRFEQFIEGFNDSLAEMISEERFKTLKKSLIASLENRFRNLVIKSYLWDQLAFQRDGDFTFVDQRIEALRKISYEDFLKQAKSFLSRKNRKRLAVLFEGKLASPFAYQPISVLDLGEIATYAPRSKKKAFKSNAALLP